MVGTGSEVGVETPRAGETDEAKSDLQLCFFCMMHKVRTGLLVCACVLSFYYLFK